MRISHKKSAERQIIFALCVMAAHVKLDSKAFRRLLSAKSIAAELQRTRLQVLLAAFRVLCLLSHPAFALTMRVVPCYMDMSLQKSTVIEFNAGLRTRSVRMKGHDFEKVEQPIVCEISMAV